MPANRRARTILVDQRHCERVRIHASPGRDPVAQKYEKARQRWRDRRADIVRPAKECDPPTRDDATHLEGRELETRDVFEELRFFITRDEVVAIVKASRDIGIEQRPTSLRHVSVWHTAIRL